MTAKKQLRIAIAGVAFAWTMPASAQPAIPWSTLASGGGRVTGPNGYTLEGTIGQFDVGVSTSGPLQVQWGFWPGALFTSTPGCVADTDDGTGMGTPDGGVTIDDLIYYLNIFELGTLGADYTNDDGVTIDDLLLYLQVFEEGF